MPIASKHGGGPAIAAVTVDTSGNTLVLPDQSGDRAPDSQWDPGNGMRQYAAIRADVNNSTSAPVYIHQEFVADAVSPKFPVGGGGIPLWPGDVYEISEVNMYRGPIYANIASGTGTLHVEVGR